MRALREIFSARSGQLSSKRVIGVLIFLCVLFVYVYDALQCCDVPSGTGELLMSGTALLGVDSVMKPFDKRKENEV